MPYDDAPPSRIANGLISLYFICLFAALTWAAYHFWHTAEEVPALRLIIETETANATGGLQQVPEKELPKIVRMVPESTAAIMVMLVGGLGALLHSMRSFYFHLTKGDLKRRRFCKYVTRPFTGSILALLFYLVVRAGLAGDEFDASEGGLLFYLAMGGLVGMFSDQTVAKLKEIAEAIFSKPEREEDEPIEEPVDEPSTEEPAPPGDAAEEEGEQEEQEEPVGEQPKEPETE